MSDRELLDNIRTDVVGSLLRPENLKQVRSKVEQGELDQNSLNTAQDEAVLEVIRKQESLDLPVVTDGEVRRDGYQDSFAMAVSGINVRSTASTLNVTLAGSRTEDPTFNKREAVSGRLKLVNNVPLAEYRYASMVANKPLKITLLGPGRIMQRFDPEKSKDVYPDIDAFVADVVAVERQMISELVQAGCRYIQLDEPSYTAYVDPTWIAAWKQRGEDPEQHLARAILADNAVMKGFDDVTFGIHVCRGNRQGMYHREGKYDSIAEQLLGSLECQRFLLEYDTERSGGFEPLRFIPEGKVAVLGLVSTKFASMEKVDVLRSRIEEASQFLPLEQLALSPQCGFASSFPGNQLQVEEQWQKLELIQTVAQLTW